MNPALVQIVVRRLDHAWPQPWRDETRDEFARSMAGVEAGERVALAAVERAKAHREWRPTVAEFSGDVAAVRAEERRAVAPVRRESTDVDKAAAAWFPSRLKAALAGHQVGDGPGPTGIAEACSRVADEFWEQHGDGF